MGLQAWDQATSTTNSKLVVHERNLILLLTENPFFHPQKHSYLHSIKSLVGIEDQGRGVQSDANVSH